MSGYEIDWELVGLIGFAAWGVFNEWLAHNPKYESNSAIQAAKAIGNIIFAKKGLPK